MNLEMPKHLIIWKGWSISLFPFGNYSPSRYRIFYHSHQVDIALSTMGSGVLQGLQSSRSSCPGCWPLVFRPVVAVVFFLVACGAPVAYFLGCWCEWCSCTRVWVLLDSCTYFSTLMKWRAALLRGSRKKNLNYNGLIHATPMVLWLNVTDEEKCDSALWLL